jgi:pyruvate/2-oxoglutarate dehydrogenase complex dihydrolipoamide dehydrogenase (E3) component
MARLVDLFQQLGRDLLTLDKNVAHSSPIVSHLPDAERPLKNQEPLVLEYGTGMMANTHWLKGSGIITEAYGTIDVDSSYQTNVQGIYAIGTVTVPSLDHADSIAMGKEVASLLAGGTQ